MKLLTMKNQHREVILPYVHFLMSNAPIETTWLVLKVEYY